MERRLRTTEQGNGVLRCVMQIARKNLHQKFALAELCRSSEQIRRRLTLAIHVAFISLNAG